MDDQAKQQRKVNIQVPEAKVEILYSDFAGATSSATGFVLDFGQRNPQLELIRIVSRVGMSPVHFKMFVQLLEKQLQTYEQRFGQVQIHPNAKSEMDEILEEVRKKQKAS